MKEIQNILPFDLIEAFDSLGYEEGYLAVQSVKYFENELHFDFSLHLNDPEESETQLWQLQVKDNRDDKIDFEDLGGYFSFYSEHCLLWEFTDVETELYFKKPTDNPEKLLAAIYTIHNTIFDNYISIEKFLNGNNLLTLCNSNNGLFARGPKQILDHYFNSLQEAGNEPYFYGEYFPKKWDGERWMPESKDLKVALLGSTYFVGETFIFKRLDK